MAGFKLIKIFVDTNIVYAAQAHLLVPNAVHKYILEHQKIESVELKWYLPSMVVEERRHQMYSAALALSPRLAEIEKLLGHSLGLNEDVMRDRVNSKVEKAIQELGIEICNLDSEKLDWEEIIRRSAHREAPFEVSAEKEKGFRDAIIANSFFQEVDRSPKTPRACLLIFVTGDKRINNYIEEKTRGSENVRIFESLDELKGFLNAIASEVTEEFLSELLIKAKNVFWDFDKKEGLFNKENIYKKITEEHQQELDTVTIGFPGCYRQLGIITLGDQTFIKKSGQTVTWNNTVSIGFKIARFETTSDRTGLQGLLGEPIILATGESLFSVKWQHQVGTKGNITKPKLSEVIFLENKFDDDKKGIPF